MYNHNLLCVKLSRTPHGYAQRSVMMN